MARTDNLSNYLTDVAQAIKDKKNDQSPINASDFDTEIANLPSGGGENIEDYISSDSTSSDASSYSTSIQILNRIKKLPPLNFSKYKSDMLLLNLFENFKQLKVIPQMTLNENITELSLSGICRDCQSLQDISNLAKSLEGKIITSLAYSFNGCQNLGDNSFEFLSSLSFKLSSCEYTFGGNNGLITKIPKFDTSSCKNFSYMLNGVKNSLISIPKLDFSSANNITNILSGTHPVLTDLGGFDNLGFMYTQKTDNYAYYKLDLSYCPALTRDSIINVFNGLADLNKTYGDEFHTQQIVLHPDVDSLLSEEDKAIATDKGWNIITQSH